MKTFAKAVLLQGVRTLPLSARRVIFKDLAMDIVSFEAVGGMARRLGLTGFVAEGDCGVIRGALDDDPRWQNMQGTALGHRRNARCLRVFSPSEAGPI